jgi:hypothetical protein
MTDEQLLAQISALVDEEQGLRAKTGNVDAARIAAIEVTLDQCWDLLRQRRAREEFHEDVRNVHARDAGTVEGYQQ